MPGGTEKIAGLWFARGGSVPRLTLCQGDNYTTGYLLDYNYFNNHLSKQQEFDSDPKAIK